MLEQKHRQELKHMKIAIIYVRPGQTNPRDMFKNDPPDSFWKFVNILGQRINISEHDGYKGDVVTGEVYYTKWKGLQVIFHLAPLLDAEGHRRLIGNDIAIIFYHDDLLGSFDPSEVGSLGAVPQIYAIIQPYKNNRYRLAILSGLNIKEYGPALPVKSYTEEDLRETLFTKIHNGFFEAAIFSPPMNRLFFTPREQTLKEIVSHYPYESKTERKKREKNRM